MTPVGVIFNFACNDQGHVVAKSNVNIQTISNSNYLIKALITLKKPQGASLKAKDKIYAHKIFLNCSNLIGNRTG